MTVLDDIVIPDIGRRWLRITLKELRETLRDRRTLLTLVLMPLMVYPMLGLVFQKFILAQFTAQAPQEYNIGLSNEDQAGAFRELLELGHARANREAGTSPAGSPSLVRNSEPRLTLVVPHDETPARSLDDMVTSQAADLGVRLQRRRSGRFVVEFIVLEGSPLGRGARDYVERRFRAVNDAFVENVLRSQQPPLRLPISWTPRVIPSQGGPPFSLASVVPLILILMTVTGAVYPAIDLTAGERERGTLEALIAAPVPRYQILCAKYAAVLVVVLLTAIANLTAMTATAFSTGLEQALFGREGLSVGLLAKLLGLLAVFATFFAAVILTLTSVARSFKEAQAYLIPLMLVSLAPGVLAMFPGLQMTALWSVTPLANIVLLTRDLFDHRVTPIFAVLTLASTAAYAGVALAVAARVFGTDAVLYGSTATWSDLVRRPAEPTLAPDWMQGLIALGGLLPAYVLLSGVPARAASWSVLGRMGANAAVLVLLFVLWPTALAWMRRIEWRGAFRWQWPHALAIVGAVCLGVSLWPFVYEIVRMISAERIAALAERFQSLEAELRAIPLHWKLLTLAIWPAICEELFFRGFLFQAIRSAASPWLTIGATAALFGLFHVLVGDALVIERFLPTALMGVALGWVSHTTGSVIPGMLLHAIHNSALLTVDRWFPQVSPVAAAASTTGGLGWPVLAVAGVVTAAGLCLVHWSRSREVACT